MKLKIPEIRTVDDYYRALFGTVKVEEEQSPVIDKLKASATKRKKGLEEKFHIQELDDRYRFHNLEYHNGIYTVDWSKELLDDGASHKQEEWVCLTEDSEFKVPSAPLYHVTIAALFENQDHPIAEQQDLLQVMREVFQQDFKDYYMMTSTRAKYAKSGNDVVTHDWNTPQARTVKGSFVGPDGYVKPGCGFDTMLEAILESKDMTLIEEAYEWIGEEGKKPYLWRINDKPNNNMERPVVLGVDGNYDRFDFYAVGVGIGNIRPARGVVTQRKKNSPKEMEVKKRWYQF